MGEFSSDVQERWTGTTDRRCARYRLAVPWDELFDDLDVRFAAGRDDERRWARAEEERLRVARLSLAERLASIDSTRSVVVSTAAGDACGTVQATGPDWVLLAGPGREDHLLPFGAITGVTLTPSAVAESLLTVPQEESAARMTLGFVLRTLARSRTTVVVMRRGAADLAGTLDRAGSDHLDIAVHERDVPRRDDQVRAIVLVPLTAVAAVRIPAGTRIAFR